MSGVFIDLFILTYHFSTKQFVRIDTRHKNLIIVLIKKHASMELLSLRIPFIKKGNC